MGLPYFYFLGVMSGFLSLIPYLGVVLAILPPVIVGLGIPDHPTFVLTCAIVVGLHLFAMNVLYPMVLGKAAATESAGRHPLPALLGMVVGRHGTDPGSTANRRVKNHLRQHRAIAALRSMDGRIVANASILARTLAV